MSDKEKDFQEKEETFEEIFSSLREKYNLDPFGSDTPTEQEEEKVFYNPAEDSEIDDFFKEKEEGYTALYEEVDAKISGVDDEALQKEAEVFNLEFQKENKSETEIESQQEYEDIYSNSDDSDTDDLQAEDLKETDLEEAAKEESQDEIEDSGDEEADEIPAASVFQPENKVAVENSDNEETEQENDETPKKKNGAGEVIRKIIFTVSIIALIGSIAWLVNDYFIQPYMISKENNEIENIIMDTENAEPEEVIEKLNNLEEEEKTITFGSLKKINPDFKAWIVVPGADISLAVVKGNNNDKYLNTGFKGKYSAGGTAFIDYQNNDPFFDTNTVIYGHNMRDGSMFGSVKNYKNLDTFKKNPYVYIYTENENYVYKIFSVFLTNAKSVDDNGYVLGYTFKNLSTAESFNSYMEEIKLRSYYDTGVDYQAGDKIITLSTCDRTILKDGRLVLVARLVRENEDESVDTSLAKKNNNQKFPAAWYKKYKTKNPYENAARWEAK